MVVCHDTVEHNNWISRNCWHSIPQDTLSIICQGLIIGRQNETTPVMLVVQVSVCALVQESQFIAKSDGLKWSYVERVFYAEISSFPGNIKINCNKCCNLTAIIRLINFTVYQT